MNAIQALSQLSYGPVHETAGPPSREGPAGALPGEYRRRRKNTEGRWTEARKNRDLVFRSKRFVPTIGFAEQHNIKDLRVFRADLRNEMSESEQ